MSAESCLVAGDTVIFTPSFAGAGILIGSTITSVISISKNTADGRGMTWKGEETVSLIIPLTCSYTFGPYSKPGTLVCKILLLHPSNVAPKIQENGKSALLVGSGDFVAELTVTSKAADPKSGNQDSTPKYLGTGKFIQAKDSKAHSGG